VKERKYELLFVSFASVCRIMSVNQQQLCLQCVDVVDHRRVWSTGRYQRYVTLSGCRRRHTCHLGVRPHFFRHVPQWPCSVRKAVQ